MKFNRQPTLKSSWSVLSAQSAKVILWFIAPIFLNFIGLLLNLRVNGLLDFQIIHQLIFVTIASVFLGGSDIINQRQEYIAAQPFKRATIFFNRLTYGLILVGICASIDFVLLNGMAEKTFYGEIMMPVYPNNHFLRQVEILAATCLFTLSISSTARTLTGLLICPLITSLFYLLALIADKPFQSDLFCHSFMALASIISCISFYEYRRISLVRCSISSIGTLTRVNWLTLAGIIAFGTILLINQPEAF